MVYIGIFLAKLVEVALGTVRNVLTVKGMTKAAVMLSTIEITIWLIVTSTVLTGIADDPIKGVAYGLAFSSGIMVGILLESKLALGLSKLEVIAEKELAREITRELREKGYGVTTSECIGRDGVKLQLTILIQRKDIELTQNMLKKYNEAFITIHDLRSVSQGKIGRRIV